MNPSRLNIRLSPATGEIFEKFSFPTIFIIFIILHLWEALILTVLVELTIYTFVIALLHKGQRFKMALKSVSYSPIRYSLLFLDIFVIANFIKDIWITKNKAWKK